MSPPRQPWEQLRPKVARKKRRNDRDTGGRPSKLTPELADKIVAIIRGGNYRQTAAIFCGIYPNTLYLWLQRNREPYKSLRRRVIEAESQAEVQAVLNITQSQDMRDRRWFLERKFPERWGQKVDMSVRGNLDTHVQIDGRAEIEITNAQLTDPKVIGLLDELERTLQLRLTGDEPEDTEPLVVPSPFELLGPPSDHDSSDDAEDGPPGSGEDPAAPTGEVS